MVITTINTRVPPFVPLRWKIRMVIVCTIVVFVLTTILGCVTMEQRRDGLRIHPQVIQGGR